MGEASLLRKSPLQWLPRLATVLCLISKRDKLLLKCSCTEETGNVVWPIIRVFRAFSKPTMALSEEVGKGGKTELYDSALFRLGVVAPSEKDVAESG
jgi:hypothetical protein